MLPRNRKVQLKKMIGQFSDTVRHKAHSAVSNCHTATPLLEDGAQDAILFTSSRLFMTVNFVKATTKKNVSRSI